MGAVVVSDCRVSGNPSNRWHSAFLLLDVLARSPVLFGGKSSGKKGAKHQVF